MKVYILKVNISLETSAYCITAHTISNLVFNYSKFLINSNLKLDILLLFVVRIVHKFTLQCKFSPVITSFCLEIGDKNQGISWLAVSVFHITSSSMR